MSPGNPFVLGSEVKVMSHENIAGMGVCTDALLWVLAFSSGNSMSVAAGQDRENASGAAPRVIHVIATDRSRDLTGSQVTAVDHSWTSGWTLLCTVLMYFYVSLY